MQRHVLIVIVTAAIMAATFACGLIAALLVWRRRCLRNKLDARQHSAGCMASASSSTLAAAECQAGTIGPHSASGEWQRHILIDPFQGQDPLYASVLAEVYKAVAMKANATARSPHHLFPSAAAAAASRETSSGSKSRRISPTIHADVVGDTSTPANAHASQLRNSHESRGDGTSLHRDRGHNAPGTAPPHSLYDSSEESTRSSTPPSYRQGDSPSSKSHATPTQQQQPWSTDAGQRSPIRCQEFHILYEAPTPTIPDQNSTSPAPLQTFNSSLIAYSPYMTGGRALAPIPAGTGLWVPRQRHRQP